MEHRDDTYSPDGDSPNRGLFHHITEADQDNSSLSNPLVRSDISFVILNYFGWLDQCASVMLRIWKRSRKIWQKCLAYKGYCSNFKRRQFRFTRILTEDHVKLLNLSNISSYFALELEIPSNSVICKFNEFLKQKKDLRKEFIHSLTLHLSAFNVYVYHQIIQTLTALEVDLARIKVEYEQPFEWVYERIEFLPDNPISVPEILAVPKRIGLLDLQSIKRSQDLIQLKGVEEVVHIAAESLYCSHLENILETNVKYLKSVNFLTVNDEKASISDNLETRLAKIFDSNFEGLRTFTSNFSTVSNSYVKEVIDYFKGSDVSVEFKASSQVPSSTQTMYFKTQELEMSRRNVKFAFFWEKTEKFKLFSAKQLEVKTTQYSLNYRVNELNLRRFSDLKITGIRYESDWPMLSKRAEEKQNPEKNVSSLLQNITVFLETNLCVHSPIENIQQSVKVYPDNFKEFKYILNKADYESIQKLIRRLARQKEVGKCLYHLHYIAKPDAPEQESIDIAEAFLNRDTNLLSLSINLAYFTPEIMTDVFLSKLSQWTNLTKVCLEKCGAKLHEPVFKFLTEESYNFKIFVSTALILYNENSKRTLELIRSIRKTNVFVDKSSEERTITLSQDIEGHVTE